MKTLLLLTALTLLGCNNKNTTDKEIASSKPENTPLKAIVYDGPFGLKEGLTAKELVEKFNFLEINESEGIFIGTPPKPINGYGTYYLIIGKNTGLCKISAIKNIKDVNGQGDQIKYEARALKDLLALKYGEPSKFYDFSTSDTYDRNPQYWMMGLKEESVFFSYYWNEETSKKIDLKNNIKYIKVETSADSYSSGFVILRYVFNNQIECESEFKKSAADNL